MTFATCRGAQNDGRYCNAEVLRPDPHPLHLFGKSAQRTPLPRADRNDPPSGEGKPHGCLDKCGAGEGPVHQCGENR